MDRSLVLAVRGMNQSFSYSRRAPRPLPLLLHCVEEHSGELLVFARAANGAARHVKGGLALGVFGEQRRPRRDEHARNRQPPLLRGLVQRGVALAVRGAHVGGLLAGGTTVSRAAATAAIAAAATLQEDRRRFRVALRRSDVQRGGPEAGGRRRVRAAR